MSPFSEKKITFKICDEYYILQNSRRQIKEEKGLISYLKQLLRGKYIKSHSVIKNKYIYSIYIYLYNIQYEYTLIKKKVGS